MKGIIEITARVRISAMNNEGIEDYVDALIQLKRAIRTASLEAYGEDGNKVACIVDAVDITDSNFIEEPQVRKPMRIGRIRTLKSVCEIPDCGCAGEAHP